MENTQPQLIASAVDEALRQLGVPRRIESYPDRPLILMPIPEDDEHTPEHEACFNPPVDPSEQDDLQAELAADLASDPRIWAPVELDDQRVFDSTHPNGTLCQ